MRQKRSILVVALICALTFTITGQEEPLPSVTPKAINADATTASQDSASTPFGQPLLIDLASEPIRDYSVYPPTLAEAAMRNDYPSFHALYTAGQPDNAAFAALHDVWTYTMTDPLGAFYGEELRDRLARAYPGFAEYIARHRIVDDRGQVFYPTAETRAFLLERAIAQTTPRTPVRLAEAAPLRTISTTTERVAPAPRRERRTKNGNALSVAPAITPASTERAGRIAGATPRDAKPAPVVTASVAKTTTPVVTTPAVITPEPAVTQPVAVQPAPAPVTVQPQPSATPAPAPAPAPAVTAKNDAMVRGLFFVAIALVGIGVLMLMLRTPKEKAVADAPPPPLKMTPPPEGKSPDARRASGSRG